MNHQQAYRVQRLILIIALMLILFGDTGMNAVFSFSHQPQSIWFYP
ncbi:putative polysaccharide biosynthesis protein (putative) [Lactiplantibacillus plantarum]|nr:putative polysaccharide biosynthesis protein (putative) [Lactiplantibacillus plantarum]